MIVGSQKPIEEIIAMTCDYKRLLVIGCGACVTVCFAGGERETEALASSLRLAMKQKKIKSEIEVEMNVRQCEWEFIEPLQIKLKRRTLSYPLRAVSACNSWLSVSPRSAFCRL